MFHRISALCLLVILSIIAAANATTTVTTSPGAPTGIPANQCNGSDLQCCNALDRSDGSLVGNLLGLLGIVIEGVEVLVGINCSPIDILGIGQNACHSQPVCCENNDFSGLIAIGCVPININL